jgi:hypothetical protein
MKNLIVYTTFIIVIMIGFVLFSTIGHASGIDDLNTINGNLTELRQLQPRQNLSETVSLEEQQQMILPIPIPTHSDAERIMMAIKMALELEPSRDRGK